jgi:hypothetical protein
MVKSGVIWVRIELLAAQVVSGVRRLGNKRPLFHAVPSTDFIDRKKKQNGFRKSKAESRSRF